MRQLKGSIIKRSVIINGRKAWRYDARRRYTRLDGSKAEKVCRCRSRDAADAKLATFDAEIRDELAGVTGPVINTFGQLCDYFEAEHVKPAVFVGDRQVSGYRQDLKTLRTYVAGYRAAIGDSVDVQKITYEHIRRYTEKLATTPVRIGKGDVWRLPKPASVNRKLSYLRRIFNIAIQLGWIDRNPFKLGKKLIDPGAEEPRERALEFDEEERLLAACEGPDVYEYERRGKKVRVERETNPRQHLKSVIIFAIETGMRKREMFTTRRTQLDFDRHVITLNAKQTKALKRRYIPMSDRLETALRDLVASRPFGKDALIFDGLKDCDRAFATACRRAGIEGLTFHGLRHTAATYMDEAGISGPARRNALGHASRRVGQRYVNSTADALESSRVKLNEFRQKLEERRQASSN